jgi:hypothetical protein
LFQIGAILLNPRYFHALSKLMWLTNLTSTWAMMLVGFAGLGYAGYRERTRSAPHNFELSGA